MNEHTKEPWAIVKSLHGLPLLVCEQTGQLLSQLFSGSEQPAEANAARIVACVNLLAGTPTEEIEERLQAKRSNEPYGRKSLRVLRRAKERGLRLMEDGSIILPTGKKHAGTPQWGRDRINLSVEGERITIQTARVVCFLAHGEPPDERCVVDHIDGNTLNDSPENVRWATYADNTINREARREADEEDRTEREDPERIRVCLDFCEGTDNEYLIGAGNLGRLVAQPTVNAELLAACERLLAVRDAEDVDAAEPALDAIRAAVARAKKGAQP